MNSSTIGVKFLFLFVLVLTLGVDAADLSIAQETAKWQNAINQASARGGGRVVVSKGVHVVGTLWLKNNVDLHLEEGAILRASSNKADYNDEKAYPENASSWIENWVGRHFIIAHSVTNVTVSGAGIIDGSGEDFFEKRVWAFGVYKYRDKMRGDEPSHIEFKRRWTIWMYGMRWSRLWDDPRPGQMVQFVNCQNVRVEGVALINAPCWNLHIWGCNQVVVRDVAVRASRSAANVDAIDIDCSSDVLVERCDIDAADDGVTFRGNERPLGKSLPCERVKVRDCSIAVCSAPFRFGVGAGLVREILIENCRVWRGGEVLTFSCAFEGRFGCDIENVTVRNVVAEGCASGESGRNAPLGVDNQFGIRNITIENCDFTRSPAGYRVSVNGQPVRLHKTRRVTDFTTFKRADIQRAYSQTEETAFVSVTAANPLTLVVELPKGIIASNPMIRSSAHTISVTNEGSVCRMTLPEAGRYIFEPDGTGRHALTIFVNAPKEWKEKWTRIFGPEEHFVGTLHLKDGDRIFLDENAVIHGNIVGENVHDVKICGTGVIDTGCYENFESCLWKENETQVGNLALFSCSDIVIDGPVLVDAADRCFKAINCERVTLNNVKAAGQWRRYADEIDVSRSRHVTILDKNLLTGSSLRR